MNNQTQDKKESKEKSNTDSKELINQLEKQVAIAVWIQFIGEIMEVLYLSKIMLISEEVRTNANERQELLASWVGTIGTFLESIGTTTQVLTSDENIQLEAGVLSSLGDWISVIGAIIDAHAGTQILIEEKEKLVRPTIFP